MSRNSHPRLSLLGSMIAGVVLMFAMPLAAQAASYTYINQPGQTTGPYMLTALNLPRVGTTFKVQVPNAWSLGWAHGPFFDQYTYLALGTKNPNIPIPALGGFLFTSADIVMAPWNQQRLGGTVTVSFQIPNSSQLVGVRFYQQVLAVYSTRYPSSMPTYAYTLSRGGYGVIGK